jgi:hypothetical protein
MTEEPKKEDHIFDKTEKYLQRFLTYSASDSAVIISWIAHTYLLDALTYTPRLALLSPEPGHGKSVLLKIMTLLLPNAKPSISMTSAVMFRMIEKERPVLQFDNADRKFEDNPLLIDLICQGFERGPAADVYRMNETNTDYNKYNVFCPLMFAAIDKGQLPDDIASRTIPIRMPKAKPAEKFRARKHGEEAAELKTEWTAWATQVIDKAKEADPEMPSGIDGREADKWESLFIAADTYVTENTNVTGPIGWGERVRYAAIVSEEDERDTTETSDGSQLRRDIDHIVQGNTDQHIFTSDLLTELSRLEDANWSDFNGYGRPITRYQLNRLLRPYGIKPEGEAVRIGDRRLRGYKVSRLRLDSTFIPTPLKPSVKSVYVRDIRDKVDKVEEVDPLQVSPQISSNTPTPVRLNQLDALLSSEDEVDLSDLAPELQIELERLQI